MGRNMDDPTAASTAITPPTPIAAPKKAGENEAPEEHVEQQHVPEEKTTPHSADATDHSSAESSSDEESTLSSHSTKTAEENETSGQDSVEQAKEKIEDSQNESPTAKEVETQPTTKHDEKNEPKGSETAEAHTPAKEVKAETAPAPQEQKLQNIEDSKEDAPATDKASPKTEEEPVEQTSTPEEPKEVAEQAAPPPRQVSSLPPVPDPELAAKSDYGLLPIISPDGRLPWRVYGRPFDDPLARPRIAIIIGDMGMSQFATRSAIQNLPGEVTLSFNPYGRDLQNWVSQARAAGHETLLQLPMEPFKYPENDPGPQSLLSGLTDKENLTRLDWMLGRFTGYAGVTNQMGSKFTTSRDDISPVLDVIKERGLLFLDGRTSGRSVAGFVAKEKSIPVVINNRFIDHRADRASIDQRLAELERIARVTGVAVGVGYPYPVTLERVSNWAKTLNRKGLVLSPLSAVANRQEIE